MVSRYEDLHVFQKAYEIALDIHKLTLSFPDHEKFAMASQMRRASKGICANIVEGFAKQSHSSAEFKRFLSICIGSSEEIRLWLKFCKDLSYINPDIYTDLDHKYLEITKMLQSLRKSWRD